jgi:myo-inositol-1(or 4)-monophosphatase
LADLSAGRPVDGDPERFEAVRALTRGAGTVVLARFGRAEIVFKADDSMVTDADIASQDWLTRQILARFPDDLVLGEEGRPSAALWPAARHVWVIDPIDGTNNFGRGMPGFSVSVGVMRDGLPIGGAVYDPVASQLFSAWTGQGAWLGDRRLRVERAILGRRSHFAIRTPYAHGVPEPVLTWMQRYRLRRTGSTALQLCYVALGGIAFMYDHQASLWDIAGAVPVLTEAGGCLTTPEGGRVFPVGAAAWRGASLAILAGVPGAHGTALRDLAMTAGVAGERA